MNLKSLWRRVVPRGKGGNSRGYLWKCSKPEGGGEELNMDVEYWGAALS